MSNATLQKNVRNNDLRTVPGFVAGFINNKLGKKTDLRGLYQVKDNGKTLIYRGRNHKDHKHKVGTDTLIVTLANGTMVGNASEYQYCGSQENWNVTTAQRAMTILNLPMLPLGVFTEVGIKLKDLSIIDSSGEETLKLAKRTWNDYIGEYQEVDIWEYNSDKKKVNTNRIEDRHFMGAMVIKAKNDYYLFDVDRRELEFYRLNAFLTKLPKKVKTVAEAYDSLIPTEVKAAIKKGLKVLRQGEWFLIPAEPPKVRKLSKKGNELVHTTVSELLEEWDLNLLEDEIFEAEDGEAASYPTLKELQKFMIYKDLTKVAQQALLLRYEAFLKVGEQRIALQIKALSRDPQEGQLQAGNNSPNDVDEMITVNDETYVCGNMSHTGRQHEDLFMEKWHKPVSNNGKQSFTLTGAID